VTLVGEVAIPFVRARLAEAGVGVRGDLPPTGREDVLVVDHYSEPVREACAARADFRLRVLVDDLGGAVPSGVDVVWNPNAYGEAASYAEFRGQVLAGPEYVPLREGLPEWRSSGASASGVMLGGGKLPERLQRALQLVAERFPDAAWKAAGDGMPRAWEQVEAVQPWTAFARCSRLIAGAGITMWEAAAVGIPVVVVVMAPNQAAAGAWARIHGVPTVDAVDQERPERLADAICAGLASARALPRVRNGAGEVVRALMRCPSLRGAS